MKVLSRCLSLRWFPRQQEYDNVAFDMTEGIISLTNRDNRHREGWGRERGGGWINGLIFTQREKQQQILTILHPSSIFLYCPQWIPAGRHTHALPREQPASIGKLNNSQGQVRTGGDRPLMMTALQGWGSKPSALAAERRTNEDLKWASCVDMCFPSVGKGLISQPCGITEGLAWFVWSSFHYSINETVKPWNPFKRALFFSAFKWEICVNWQHWVKHRYNRINWD